MTDTTAPKRTTDPTDHPLCCPECGEPARPTPPAAWTSSYGPAPSYAHLDGTPLCPVIDKHGYHPAHPVRICESET
jgi:hypothetical protein